MQGALCTSNGQATACELTLESKSSLTVISPSTSEAELTVVSLSPPPSDAGCSANIRAIALLVSCRIRVLSSPRSAC